MRVVAVVPAAGRSSRFGGPKLMADVGGRPLIDQTLGAFLATPGISALVVVVSPGAAFPGVPSLDEPRVVTVVNPDPSRGMLSSIQAGVRAAAGADLILVLPADMPFVASATIALVRDAAASEGDALVVPVHQGRRGHPIAMPARLREVILQAAPEMTLKDVLATSGVRRVELPVDDAGILRDVDVPSDLDQ